MGREHHIGRQRQPIRALLWVALVALMLPFTIGGSGTAHAHTSHYRPGADDVTLRTLRAARPEHPQLSLGERSPGPNGSTSYQVSYSSGGLRITGLLLVPGDRGRHPGVVLVHGFADPETYTTGGELVREQEWLVRAGYVVLVPDLRNFGGSDSVDGPPDLDMGSTLDVVNAVRALHAAIAPGFDRHDISLVGHSAGGLLVLNAAVVAPEAVSRVVALAPTNVDPWVNVEYFLGPENEFYDAIVDSHGTPATNPCYWRDITPATFVRRSTPPLLIVQGAEDDILPHDWAAETTSAWRSAGGRVHLSFVPGDHIFYPDGGERAMSLMIKFLRHRS